MLKISCWIVKIFLPSPPAALMSVHFEAKKKEKNLYFVLLCLQDAYYFSRGWEMILRMSSFCT